MPVDPSTLHHYLGMSDLATRPDLTIDGIRFPLPIRRARRASDRHLDWQRRVLDDIMPDSVNADAPERMPFSILYRLTTGQRTSHAIDDVLKGELAPLEPLFRAQAVRKKMTLAFHVLAVKGADRGEQDTRGFTERTFLLLCRDVKDHAGRVDEGLVQAVVDRFRTAPADLDLAQRTLLERLQPGWSPRDEPHFDLPDRFRDPVQPFDGSAARLFQRDLRTLLDVDLPPADFFHHLNLLLALHMGLYQPRLAAYLNPQVDLLLEAIADPHPGFISRLEAWLAKAQSRHPFEETLWCRAPDAGTHRKVSLQSPARQSWQRLSTNLARFHFSLLMMVRLRQLAVAFKAAQWGVTQKWLDGTLDSSTREGLELSVNTPEAHMNMIVDEPEFREFLLKAGTALAVRFVRQQLAEATQGSAIANIRTASTSIHALRDLYVLFNQQNASNTSSTRAVMQGIQVVSRLLNQGQYGIVQPRARVGPYFEMGAGILPLLILLIVGAQRPKVNIATFWRGLGEYGLAFRPDERDRLLSRLKAMGIFERFSDAGEAAYVRNLMIPGAA